MKKDACIYVADHTGLFGSAIVRRLHAKGYSRVLTATKDRLDLLDQQAVLRFFQRHTPEYVFLAAQLSGGVLANIKYPARYFYENTMIQSNVIHAAAVNNVRKLMFFGASCMYPVASKQPISEKALLQGPIEKTSEAYGVAKIAGSIMCAAYATQYRMQCVPVVPATAYGPGASFDLESSHVIAALIRKFHEAKVQRQRQVVIWGTGKPRREFLYVDDLADACIFLMRRYRGPELVNIGYGEDIPIRSLATVIKNIVGFRGSVVFDRTKPDGVFRKLLDTKKIAALGWHPSVLLEEGIRRTYHWYVQQ